MHSVIRSTLAVRAPRAHLFLRPARQSLAASYAGYGNAQSGHENAHDEANPREDLEHPGPKAPAEKGTNSSSEQQSSSGSSSGGNQPKIHHPESQAEKDNPEVREHNEDMRYDYFTRSTMLFKICVLSDSNTMPFTMEAFTLI